MLLKEAMKATGLSKKAIQYYEDKALIVPKKLNNGYRDYDETVIQQLKNQTHACAPYVNGSDSDDSRRKRRTQSYLWTAVEGSGTLHYIASTAEMFLGSTRERF